MHILENFFIEHSLSPKLSVYLAKLALGILIIFLCFIANIFSKHFLKKIISYKIKNDKYNIRSMIFERKLLKRFAILVPCIIIYISSSFFGNFEYIIKKIITTYSFVVITLIINSILNLINDIYITFPISKARPIKGLLQVIEIISYIIIGIIVVSNLIDQNPVALISGIGALTAVFSLVFKDLILGFVAGIQLSYNNMIQIGDRIELNDHDTDGDVIDISLTTIKIQNYDNSITMIPTSLLVTESFKNWYGMKLAGVRRLKKSIYIDVLSVKFCTKELLENINEIYPDLEYDSNMNLSNLTLFRLYIIQYMKNHPMINQKNTLLVRTLQQTEIGIPLEIYAFVNTLSWAEFEKIQCEIFEQLFCIAHYFDIKIYQKPSGYDILYKKLDI